MTFGTRNAYYLRISLHNVLPTFVYLDERHVDWMSDRVLERVLADLRPRILPKLRAEADIQLGPGGSSSTKKLTVDTHRGDTYQFCYFFQKTEPHSVVVKTRRFVTAPVPPRNMPTHTMPPPPPKSKSRRSKRKGVDMTETENYPGPGSRPRNKIRRKRLRVEEREEDSTPSSEGEHVDGGNASDNIPASITPQLQEKPQPTLEVSAAPGPETVSVMPSTMDIDIETEEEKPKPILQIKYQGFNIYGHCLCVVVEPWPLFRSLTYRPSTEPVNQSRLSVASNNEYQALNTQSLTVPDLREKTPLFLVDVDDDDFPVSAFTNTSDPRPTTTTDQPILSLKDDEHSNSAGMMEFSQILSAIGSFRTGVIDGEDEAVVDNIFFGDADENREL